MTTTSDVYDEHPDAQVCELQLRDFGGVRSFSGPVATVRCLEDNLLVRQMLSEPGEGRVLVVDAGGSYRCALVGENIATLARDNGWAGIVLHGCVRDVDAIATVQVGIKAIGSCPRPSRKTGKGDVGVPVRFGNTTYAWSHQVFPWYLGMHFPARGTELPGGRWRPS